VALARKLCAPGTATIRKLLLFPLCEILSGPLGEEIRETLFPLWEVFRQHFRQPHRHEVPRKTGVFASRSQLPELHYNETAQWKRLTYASICPSLQNPCH